MNDIESVSQGSVEVTATLLSALTKKINSMDLDGAELFEVGEVVKQLCNLQRGLSAVVKELRSIKKDAVKSVSNLPPDKQVEYLLRAIQKLPRKYQIALFKAIDDYR